MMLAQTLLAHRQHLRSTEEVCDLIQSTQKDFLKKLTPENENALILT